jgi:dihydrolipoamide dehydrogenase
MEQPYDLTVIGSGPGGYVAAIRASQLGMKTAVVEMAPVPGGTCLNWGCIPTKALLQAAEVLETARHAKRFGIKIGEAELDLKAVHGYKNRVVRSNVKGIEYLFKKNGIRMLSGRGRLAGPGRVEVSRAEGEPYTIDTRFTVLATGSVISGLPGVEFDGRRVLHSDHALQLDAVPASLIVLGAGAVGVEFASIYRTFGADVTVVELLPSLIPIEEPALGAELEKAFRNRGIGVHTGTRVREVAADENGVRLTADKEGDALELSADALLVAVGRRPATDDLGLDGTGIAKDERGFIVVDAMMRTDEQNVYAIGDIVCTPALAHVASHEGVVAVEHAAGRNPLPIEYDRIPSCTYSRPEVASIGLSEAEARNRGHDVVVGTFPFAAVGKAKILDDTRGFVRIVSEKKYDEVLGIHVIGPHATELIAEGTAALNLEDTVASLIHAIHAHPTLAEAIGEAALDAHDRAIHI